MVQQEDVLRQEATNVFLQLETRLSNKQAKMVNDLFYSHCCMLEHQAHTSMILLKLVTSLDLKSFIVVLKVLVK